MAEYVRPPTLAEALRLRAGGASPLAGATDLLPAATTAQAWFRPTPGRLLDLSALPELKGLSIDAHGWRFGALTTWSDVIEARLPAAFDGLKTAARQVGGAQIQNRGTLGGNLCNASPAADGAPCLLALDAGVELASLDAVGGIARRQLPLAEFLLGNRQTALRPGELMSALRVPTPAPGERSTFLKLGARHSLVISIASVAAQALLDTDGRFARLRIAVGACSAVPQRLLALEARCRGLTPAEASAAIGVQDLAALSPIDDVRASAAYRRDAALTLVRRALAGFASGHAMHGGSRAA